jgi:hypothetical protein
MTVGDFTAHGQNKNGSPPLTGAAEEEEPEDRRSQSTDPGVDRPLLFHEPFGTSVTERDAALGGEGET